MPEERTGRESIVIGILDVGAAPGNSVSLTGF
jgi:hypothetical protein